MKFSLRFILPAVLLLGVGFGAGWWTGSRQHGTDHPPQADTDDEREVLYWYDPMVPQQRFDQPGPSPFMDMDLVPRYAGQEGAAGVVQIDSRIRQNLGMRTAEVRPLLMENRIEASGVLQYNQRVQADVQLRSRGFVEEVWPLAEGDLVQAEQPLARVLLPDWAAEQQEYLAVRGMQDSELLETSRERLRLMGMPRSLVEELDESGEVQSDYLLTAPIAGVLESFAVRQGMVLAEGTSIARINNIDTLWLEVAVPERYAGQLRRDDPVTARFNAPALLPAEGHVEAVLPQLDLATRTLRVRVSLPNPDQDMRPGTTARVTLVAGESYRALAVPTEAVIRTGQRSLVMLAEGDGRYRPVQVETGQESGEYTEIISGLQEGQQVVSSGQFLLDSEATLLGLTAEAAVEGMPDMDAPEVTGALHEATAVITEINETHVTLDHEAFETLPMPAMTMRFEVSDPRLLEGLEPGDTVRAGIRQLDTGLVVEQLDPLTDNTNGAQP